MAETAGTAGSLSTTSPTTSDDIAAFASAEADSSPASPSDSATPAPAIVESEVNGSSVPDTPGPIPFDRHTAVLENARRKAREEADQEWRQKYGWAERYQPDQVENSSRLYQWLAQNPKGFMAWLRTQVGEDAAPTPPVEEGPPQPDLRAEDGTPVYSAPQLQKYMDWKDRQYRAMVEPLEKKLTQRDEQDRMRQTAWAAKSSASGLLKYAREKWPMFAELEPSVLKSMQQNPKLSFHDAYIRTFAESGPSKLKEQAVAEYQGTLAQKSNASTSPPGKPTGAPRKYTEMDTLDLVKQEYEAMTRKR